MTKKRKNVDRGRFDIDFFEFSFLVEACIPERPIARAMFWHDTINKYYHVLTVDERSRLYGWINLNPNYKSCIEKKNRDCLLFDARYNPNNQYKVKVYNKALDKEETYECFKFNDWYYIKIDVSINDEFIVDIEKIEYDNNINL